MSKENFLKKLQTNNKRTFLLPTLQETVTYRRLDVIESSFNESIPNFLSSQVLGAMKNSISGRPAEDVNLSINDNDMKDLLIKATSMWKKLVSDPELTDEEIIEIPSEDRIAWFVNAVAESQRADTQGGGVTDAVEVATFPKKARNTKHTERALDSESV